MSVDLSPEELGFRRPFNHEVTQVLSIRNHNNKPVAFKVKTTAPKQYCVRPNSGIAQPGSTVEVQVLLQAMKEDPPLEARCRDKFLVQSMAVDEIPQDDDIAKMWSTIEKSNKSAIQERKIRVQFLPADAPTTNGVGHERVTAPPAYEASPVQNYNSPSPNPSSMISSATYASDINTPSRSTATDRSAFSSSATPSQIQHTQSQQAQQAKEEAVGGLQGVTQAVINAVPKNTDELQQQLAAAQASIKDLTNQLADPQLRQRKIAETKETVQQVAQQAHQTGVPLEWCAGLCLLSFIIAYLFF